MLTFLNSYYTITKSTHNPHTHTMTLQNLSARLIPYSHSSTHIIPLRHFPIILIHVQMHKFKSNKLQSFQKSYKLNIFQQDILHDNLTVHNLYTRFKLKTCRGDFQEREVRHNGQLKYQVFP
ncbi:hypothetical protein VIGAN_04082900 [Vigna angularis var. angularis]|uniref:Uncharacterized protein n=1 Tax=Vigna angularis var. angularis TaxID=157739 RepID=A0A0S3RSX4_PHAAN|nr:hypothetical protein VIGAN_01062300 [Vigna angularis var. angularis]BAT73734.1 hypothetical protein VIGAN_01125800 [Vigna angularis var. angularis]BAT83645.1 hypothetical protein VIGAN_04082900 [Vigna angularis var. angularis]